MEVKSSEGSHACRQAVRIALSEKQRNRRRHGHDRQVASLFRCTYDELDIIRKVRFSVHICLLHFFGAIRGLIAPPPRVG